MHLLAPLVALAALAAHVSAVTWYYLDFTTPSGSYITSFSGTLVAPTLPQAATYYLWPGLQPAGNAGVLQQVLDGRSGEWWIGSGWCCSDPSLSWGSGFNGTCCEAANTRGRAVLMRWIVANGASVAFSNEVDSIDNGTWSTSLSSGSNSATGSFALPTHPMDQAIMAIELYDVSWDFGKLAFENVVIVRASWSPSYAAG